MTDKDLIASLAARMQRLEDEAEIKDVLANYCLAADGGDAAAMRTLFTSDCKVDIDNVVFMNGVDQVEASVKSDAHQGMLPNAAHIVGPIKVVVDGDRAVATCYMSLFLKGESVNLGRMSLGRWEFEKSDGWRIARRTARSVGGDTKPLMEGAASPG